MRLKKPSETGTDARKYFGSELRRWREDAGLTQTELADLLPVSARIISFVETGRRPPTLDFTERVDEVLECHGALRRIWPLIEGSFYPVAFTTWLSIESDAQGLHVWQPALVPGLLQTEAYARTVFSGEPGVTRQQVEDRVQQRLERQKLLVRENAPMYHVILDEGVLRRPVGGRSVIREQIEHLINMTELPNVSVQIVPLDGDVTIGLLGACTIAQLQGSPDTVYVESVSNPQVVTSLSDVSMIKRRHDVIRAGAHPRSVSLRIMKEVMAEWI